MSNGTETVQNNTNDMMPKENKSQKVIVLLSTFLTVTVCIGVIANMSVLNNEWMEYYQKSKVETSLIQSLALGLNGIGGFPSGLAIAKFGPMKVGILGGCILALGLCLSFFATSIFFLVITIGIIGGFGVALAMNSAFASASQNFYGKQATMAFAFIIFGGGIGGMCIPMLLQLCIDMFGWRGTLLILGGLAMNVPIWATTYKLNVSRACKTSKPSQKTSFVDILKSLKDLTSNMLYICFLVALAMVSATNTIYIFLVDYLESCGLSRQDAISIYFWMTLASTIFRLLPGICKILPLVSTLSLPAVFSCFACIALFLLPNFKTRIFLTIAVSCYGASVGCILSVNPIILLKLIQREQFPTAFGVSGAVSGMSGVVAVALSGYLRDISGNYSLSFYSSSAAFGVACILYTGIFIYRSTTKRTEVENKNYEIEIDISIESESYVDTKLTFMEEFA